MSGKHERQLLIFLQVHVLSGSLQDQTVQCSAKSQMTQELQLILKKRKNKTKRITSHSPLTEGSMLNVKVRR